MNIYTSSNVYIAVKLFFLMSVSTCLVKATTLKFNFTALHDASYSKSGSIHYPEYNQLIKKYGRKIHSFSAFRHGRNKENNACTDFPCLASKSLQKAFFFGNGNRTKHEVSKKNINDSLKYYWQKYPQYASNEIYHNARNKTEHIESLTSGWSNPNPNKDKFMSLLEVGAKIENAAGGCEVCVYVVENKEQHQPFLCRGLKNPEYQQTCVSILVSLMWWLENEVYWLVCFRFSDFQISFIIFSYSNENQNIIFTFI